MSEAVDRSTLEGQGPNRPVDVSLEAALGAIPEALLITDVDGRIVRLNSAAERLLGLPATHVLGRLCNEVMPECLDGGHRFACPVLDAIRSRSISEGVSARWVKGADEHLDLTLTLSPIVREDGSVSGAVVRLHEASRCARDAVGSKSGLISMVSHELRSRLSSISVSAELLLGQDLDKEAQQEILEVVRTQSTRLAGFFERLLDAESLQAGNVTIDRQPLAVVPLIRRVVASLPTDATGHRFDVVVNGSVPFAYGDEDKTESVLHNLVENAVNYSRPGSIIRVMVSLTAEDAVEVSVTDEGPGIPETQRDLVFERLFRIESRGGRPTYGHGLGLWIAKGFVEAQGGRIWVDSTPGVGSTFHFTIPRFKEETEL